MLIVKTIETMVYKVEREMLEEDYQEALVDDNLTEEEYPFEKWLAEWIEEVQGDPEEMLYNTSGVLDSTFSYRIIKGE